MLKSLCCKLLIMVIILSAVGNSLICVNADNFPIQMEVTYTTRDNDKVTRTDITSRTDTITLYGVDNLFDIKHGIQVIVQEYEYDGVLSIGIGGRGETNTRGLMLPVTFEYFKEGINKIYVTYRDNAGKIYEQVYTFNVISDNNSTNSANKEDESTSFGSNVSDWAKNEVEEAYDNGLVPKTLVGKDLTQKINRSEFAAVAVLVYENLTGKSASSVSTPFNDIKYDDNKDSIAKAYALGITVGTSDVTFSPSKDITREELATMLCRGIKKYKFSDWTPDTDYMYYIQGISGKKFADDAEISNYARDSVYFMNSAGIIKGVDSTHFAPKASVTRGDALNYGMATREQAIVMANRIKKNKAYFDEI